jgi:hypothetical protein
MAVHRTHVAPDEQMEDERRKLNDVHTQLTVPGMKLKEEGKQREQGGCHQHNVAVLFLEVRQLVQTTSSISQSATKYQH